MANISMKILSVFSLLTGNVSCLAASTSAPDKLTFWQKLGLLFSSFWEHLKNGAISFLYTIFYAIGKFILNIVDFLAIAVKELAGQNAVSDLANIKKATEVDMVFRFVFDSTILQIFKALLGLSVVLLIIFAIIALLKNEYDAFLGGAEDNSKGQIVKRTLTSIFMIIIVPFMAFGGVLLSNAVLTSIDRALGSRSGNSTIANEVYIASTYEANQYRRYADADLRIPITFDFYTVDSMEIALPEAGYSNDQMNSAMQEYINRNVWERGYYTWWQFYNAQFNTFGDINDVEIEAQKQNTIAWTSFYDKNLQIVKADYYVMADMTEHLVRTGEILYVVNAYELMQQMGSSADKVGQYVCYDYYDSNGNLLDNLTSPFYQLENGEYAFRVYYDSKLAKDIPGLCDDGDGKFYVEHTFNNSHDEAKGAMYLLCRKVWVEENGNKVEKYVPICNNTKKVNYYSGVFWSDYLAPGQLVVARGCFNSDGYPTAIRDNSGNVEFYRDEIVAPSLFDIFPQITYESQDGQLNLMGGLNAVFKTITGVDISELVPKVYFRDDIWNLFTKRDEKVAVLSSGEFAIDYTFSNGIPLSGVVNVPDINILVLLFGSVLLLSVLGKAMFGLIGRVFDLVLLFITYPVFAATMPLDDGARFKNWTSSFVSKVLGAYGIVIGLNLVFILVPVVAGTNAIFTPEFVAEKVRVRGLSVQNMTTLMNFGVWLMFYLVLFSFIKTAADLVTTFVGGENSAANADDVTGGIKDAVGKASNIITGKFLVDGAKRLTGDVKGFIPGSAIVSSKFGKDEKKKRKEDKKAEADIAQRKADLQSGNTARLAGQVAHDDADAKKAKAEKEAKEAKEKRKKIMRGE